MKPGTWAHHNAPIDLMVPAGLGGPGRRSACLGPHGTEVAPKAKGLEAATVDNNVFTLTALDPTDTRRIEVAIAGLAALLVAKLHKLAEREHTPERWSAKDGLDVLRILQGADLINVAATLAALERTAAAGAVTVEARGQLRRLFGTPTAHGSAMAAQATTGVEDPATISGACVALASELLQAWESAVSG